MPLLLGLALGAAAGARADDGRLQEAAVHGDWKRVKSMGPAVLPSLARLYEASPEEQRAMIAYVFYQLGWRSPEAMRALMKDAHTKNPTLRLQVQWALGRVSADPEVVDVLLQNMRTDPEPLFRDEAASALAYDQIHLAPAQKARMLEGLIEALDDPVPQVRQIALQALHILTGQTRGFGPDAPPAVRQRAVEQWRRWLLELEKQP